MTDLDARDRAQGALDQARLDLTADDARSEAAKTNLAIAQVEASLAIADAVSALSDQLEQINAKVRDSSR